MATTTPNINLTKPVATDNFDLATWNGNMDKIDTAAGTIPETDTFNITAVNSAYALERNTGVRFGKVCILSIDVVSTVIKSPTDVKVATLPVGFRPVHSERIPLFATAWDGSNHGSGWANIATNGDITISSGTANTWFGQATWVTA